MLKQKKGQLEILAPAVIIMFIAAAVLFFGLVITENLRDTTKDYNAIYHNESTTIAPIGNALDRAGDPGFNSPTIILVTNATTGEVIAAGNYTLIANNSLIWGIVNATARTYTIANITYTYKQGGQSYRSANSTIGGLGTFADFWTIIILAIIISIIIGIILMVLSRRTVK